MGSGACEFPAFQPASGEIDQILATSKTIAVIGASPKPDRPSNYVPLYLQDAGYKLIPVNPGQTEVYGEKCYKSLSEIPEHIDIVDIFRPAEAVPEIVEEAIKKGAKTIWMQSGIVHNEAGRRAKEAGLNVVMSRCLMVEHQIWHAKQA